MNIDFRCRSCDSQEGTRLLDLGLQPLANNLLRVEDLDKPEHATAGGATALRRDDIGVLAEGRAADIVLLDAPSYVHLAYRPGAPVVAATWRSGRQVFAKPGRP